MLNARLSLDNLRVPVLPAAVLRIRELLAQEDTGVADVAKALAHDPPLAIKILRIANSVQYATREAQTSIQTATSVLGLRTVASIVVRAGVLSLFENLKDSPEFSVSNIWKHSILTAHASEELAKVLRRRWKDFTPQDYYTCGLLHDIGRIVLFDNFGADYVRLINGRPEGQSEREAEASGLLGLDHAELGALAAGIWRLPAPIPELIQLHHKTTAKGHVAEIIALVACADRIAELVFEHPNEDARQLAAKVVFPPPGCTSAVGADLIQSVRKHSACLEL